MPFSALKPAATLLGLSLLAGPAHAQAPAALPADSLAGRLARYAQARPTEQLFVHFDRPAYAAGDAMWLKVYALSGPARQPSPLSRVAYVEVLDGRNQVMAQAQLALGRGRGQGQLLLPATLPSGRYQLRAYTRWMQNFDPAAYFQAPLLVANVTTAPAAPTARPAGAAAYDIQFMPEGGQLVRGLPGRLGVKVLDSQGRSLAATGTVADRRGQVVASFATLKYGLGSFSFTPTEAGAGYVATLRLPGGASATVPLPAVQAQGYAVQLLATGPDAAAPRLLVRSSRPEEVGRRVHLLAHAGQQVRLAQTAVLQAGQATFALDPRQLPAGITHLTVFDGAGQPLAERLYFRRPRGEAGLRVQANQASYSPRQRVQLTLGAPAAANVSLAVFQLDSLATATAAPPDIAAYLLLAADLRGQVEDPGYYLRDSSATANLATDNLLLTQGWSRFRWAEVLAAPPPPAYLPEAGGPLLRVRVRTASGAPAPGVGTYLSSPNRTGRFYYARTQADGVALFEPRDFAGPQRLVVQTDLQDQTPYALSLLSPYSTQFAAPGQLASWQPTPALAPTLTQRLVQQQAQQVFSEVPTLREPAADSTSVYGKISEQYRLDDYTRFRVMEEVMREYVPGVLVRREQGSFRFKNLDRPHQLIFQDEPLVLLDGVPVRTNELMAFDPLKVQRLNIIAGRYHQGSRTYDGVVSYTTYKGDLGGFVLPPQALLEEYDGPQGQREFYAPRYDTDSQRQSRLPDLRSLLHWQPEVLLAAGQPRQLSFYTSDQVGRYLVVAQGITADGRPLSTTTLLEVKPAL